MGLEKETYPIMAEYIT